LGNLIRENIKALGAESLGCYDLKQYKLCFDEEFSKLLDEMKQAILH